MSFMTQSYDEMRQNDSKNFVSFPGQLFDPQRDSLNRGKWLWD